MRLEHFVLIWHLFMYLSHYIFLQCVAEFMLNGIMIELSGNPRIRRKKEKL